MKSKHVPQRLCIVCGTFRPKRELCRLVKLPGGNIRYDAENRMSGKGMYLCCQPACLEEFTTGKKFKKRFHSSLGETTLNELNELKNRPEQATRGAPDNLQGKIGKEG